MKTALLLCVAAVLLTSCRSNPYPPGGFLVPHRPVEVKPTQPPYVFGLADVLDFEEGTEAKYDVQPSVPPPGKPIVTVTGLPAGAVFDDVKMRITWTPPFDAANDPKDISVVARKYPVTFTLRSSEGGVSSRSKTVTLLVNDKPQAFVLKYGGTGNLWEGKGYQRGIKIENPDFPRGPFKLSAQGASGPITITENKNDPTKFQLSYTPDFREVTTRDKFYPGYGHYKIVPVTIRAFAPRGESTHTVEWTILDVRQSPRVSGPTKVVQGTEANFTLNVEDPNGEAIPTMRAPKPPYGNLTFTKLAEEPGLRGTSNPSAAYGVRWDRIPEDKFGATEKLAFEVCVLNSVLNGEDELAALCKPHEVTVTFQAVVHAPPVIDRSNWPQATTRYLRAQEKAVVMLPIRDGEGLNTPPTVVVEPAVLRDEIKWDRNRLHLTPKAAGTKPFTLVVTSAYGVVRVENFVLETVPSSWSPTLILGDSLEDPEIAKTLTVLGGGQVANPSLQPLDDRLLALRTTLVVGTSAVKKHPFTLPFIEEAAQKVKNIVLHSSLLETFQGKVVAEMKSGGLTLVGRMSTLPGPLPPLAQFNLFRTPQSGFTAPETELKLAGTLTPESANPLTLRLESGARCQPLLELYKENPELRFLVAVRCPRSNGGKLVVAGFEWSDLATAPADASIPGKWWKEAQGE